jgi:hypothetical protein
LITNVVIKRDVNNWWWELTFDMPQEAYELAITEIRYTQLPSTGTGNTLYFGIAESGLCNGYVANPKNMKGFGGQPIHMIMADGRVEEIYGPWSGRPAVYMHAGAVPCDEVHIKMSRWGTMAQYMTQEAIDAIIAHFELPFRTVVRVEDEYLDDVLCDNHLETKLVIETLKEYGEYDDCDFCERHVPSRGIGENGEHYLSICRECDDKRHG